MDVSLQRRALQVLSDALGRPAARREAWVRRACGDDPALMSAVLRLMRSDAVGAAVIPTEPREPLPMPDRPPPERIGPYRLTELLGEGGMSRVYLAERDDGLFDHAVAVKLMRPRAFGQLSRDLFDEERRILARLKHPNIAQLFDGGVDPEGSPYLVMERLTGLAIDTYVRQHRLSVREMVGLVLQVCAAVRHAHQSLVVHADIKPSNVLVDQDGVAKLLDFGVAQTLGRPEQDDVGAFPVTAVYASPQRLAGERPSPSDDVFALGALLHDLLSGVAIPSGDRGAPSITLRAGQPSKEDLARARSIAGDLDAVTLKALSATADDRYPSVEAMADDLSRWLEGRPVRARNPDWKMETGRFVRRHPWAIGASAAAVVGLIIALAATTSLYLEAHRARVAAEQRFADVRGMAKYLLFDLYDHLDRTPQSLALRRDLAREGQAYLSRLTADPDAPVPVQVETIQGLVRLAAVQGQPGRSNLGEIRSARVNLDRASRIAVDLTARHPDRPDVWLAAANVDIARAGFNSHAENSIAAADKAIADAKVAIDRAKAMGASPGAVIDADIEWRLQAAGVREWQGRYADAAALARAALADITRSPAPGQAAKLREARASDLLAEATFYGGDEPGAEAPYRREMAVMEEVARLSPADPTVLRALATSRWALGTTLLSIRKAKEALPVLDAGVGEAERLVAFDASDQDAKRTLRITRIARAQALAAVHRYPEAIGLLRDQVAERRTVWLDGGGKAEAARDYAISLSALGDVEADARRRAEACADYARSQEAFEAIRRQGRLTDLDRDYALGKLRQQTGKLCGAQASAAR